MSSRFAILITYQTTRHQVYNSLNFVVWGELDTDPGTLALQQT